MTSFLDSYCARIGYVGPRPAELATLHAIMNAHVRSVPFENLDALADRGVDLAPDAVARKIIESRRGGYCFEQNSLLLRVLRELGFAATPIPARVRWKQPREVIPPRTHVLLRVEIDGATWLVDAGIGNLSPSCALAMIPGLEQPTPHETRRVIELGAGLFMHQVHLAGEWSDVCEFSLDEMPEIDRTVANWFTSTHPASKFRNHLLVALAGPDGTRLAIMDTVFSIRDKAGHAEKVEIGTVEQLQEILATHFALRIPEGADPRAWPCCRTLA